MGSKMMGMMGKKSEVLYGMSPPRNVEANSTSPIISPGRTPSLTGPPRNHLTAETNSSGVEAGLKQTLTQQKTLVSQLKGFLVQQHLVEPQ